MEQALEQNGKSGQPPIRVLLIDDQQIMATYLSAMLASEKDIDFFYCAEAPRAVEDARRISPTVVLMDMVMPDIDGLELLKEFRGTTELTDIPIIVLSSNEDAVMKGHAFEIGANDYLVKLPDALELIARIRYHSRAYTEHAQLQKTVNQLEEAHSQLLQSEKMASIGQLAAGVAHEINNPIGFVGSNMGSLRNYLDDVFTIVAAYEKLASLLPEDNADVAAINTIKQKVDWQFLKEDSVQLMDECKDGINRVKQIVNDLKDFSRVDEAEWQWSDLHKGLDSTLNIVNNEIKYKANVVKDYAKLPQVECIPSQLNQVFMNMLVNAAHAIDDHGTITIRTELDGSGDKLCVSFTDTGKGMDEATMRMIFDPFYTTKPVGQGTGLGLSLSYGIINRHGGLIEVASVPGKGTTFRLHLPVKQAESMAAN